ncbi:zinc finger protein 391 isoform X4 [Teleopsis dalmanni]|uniref:zinc finger protein 391 isoform X4 n=1 Tax=Teleopsis dalmanni TaxID=139649 RepID=UPI0018CC9EBC|nr:zinc finger protein 391 isoform X4 [Teleopsis dalmanni]
MESICRLCFQPAALFQVPGYNIPTCVKCSEHLTANGFYPSVRGDGTTVATTATAGATQLSNGNNSVTQQQQQIQTQQNQQQQQPQQQLQSTSSSENLQDDSKDVDLIFNEEGSCPLCNKTFSRKSSLLTHIRNHAAERKYVCTYCHKGFTQAANLRNHERIHTNDRPYTCVDCGKTFTQITNLNNHRRLHTGERPFVCIEPECGRSFAQVTNLNNHMKTHHKVQQYCCNQCPKKFTQVTSLNQHLQAHAGITGYYCPRCPEKTFKQQSQLHTHMKSHGLAFPFECSKCDEKFLQQAHLDQHLKMHDEFKFKCDICPSSFNQESLLKKHVQRHVEGRCWPSKYLTCPVANCNEAFAVRQHLSKHLLTSHSHNELPPPKRSKKSITLQPPQQPVTMIGQPLSIQHSTGQRGRPPKNKNKTQNATTSSAIKIEINAPLHNQHVISNASGLSIQQQINQHMQQQQQLQQQHQQQQHHLGLGNPVKDAQKINEELKLKFLLLRYISSQKSKRVYHI